jgi:hypothetical protein
MPFGSSMACGDAAKGERIEGFFFMGRFAALIITRSLVKCVSPELFQPQSPCYGRARILRFALQ